MTARRVHEQRAHLIQNADVIHNNSTPQVDHRTAGLRALDERRYGDALRHFDALLDDGRTPPDVWYYSALALLRGVRPLRHAKATLIDVERRLQQAGAWPAAVVLRALVADDYTQAWRWRRGLPGDLATLIRSLDRSRLQELVGHVRAPESRVWMALQNRRTA
jgi:hypothetical protein